MFVVTFDLSSSSSSSSSSTMSSTTSSATSSTTSPASTASSTSSSFTFSVKWLVFIQIIRVQILILSISPVCITICFVSNWTLGSHEHGIDVLTTATTLIYHN
eukprot:959194_1